MNAIRFAASRVASCHISSNRNEVLATLRSAAFQNRRCTFAQQQLTRSRGAPGRLWSCCAHTAAANATVAPPTTKMPSVQDHSSFANLSQAIVKHVDLGTVWDALCMHVETRQPHVQILAVSADLRVKFEQQVVEGSAKVSSCILQLRATAQQVM